MVAKYKTKYKSIWKYKKDERDRWERRERMSSQGSLYYFIELYVKIKIEMLGILLDELVK